HLAAAPDRTRRRAFPCGDAGLAPRPRADPVRRARSEPLGRSRRYGGPMKRFEGKVAVVTGGAKGIGAACTVRFASEGAAVYVADIDEEAGRRIAEETEGSVFFVRCDASRLADWETLASTALDVHGNVDVLVSNAFTSTNGAPHELSEEDWDRTQ